MEWISVKDNLPGEPQWCLAYSNEMVCILFFDGINDTGEHWLDNGDWEGRVTHWMPLPDPPKDKNLIDE